MNGEIRFCEECGRRLFVLDRDLARPMRIGRPAGQPQSTQGEWQLLCVYCIIEILNGRPPQPKEVVDQMIFEERTNG